MIKKRILMKSQNPKGGVYNPTVCENNIFYRTEGSKGISSIAQAEYKIQNSRVKITSKEVDHVITPEYDYEIRGCEDPRVVRIGDKFFMTYVGTGNGSLCLAESNDMIRWDKRGVILKPAEIGWDSRLVKAGTIFPHKVGEYYYMFYLGEMKSWHTRIGIVRSKNLYDWKRFLNEPVLAPRKGHFDSQGVEPCATFYEGSINAGVLIYAGWDKRLVHQGGIALFSMESPEKIIYRRSTPFLEPKESWEKYGKVPNVVFPTGVLKQPDKSKINILWGAADKVIGEKPYSIEELLGK